MKNKSLLFIFSSALVLFIISLSSNLMAQNLMSISFYENHYRYKETAVDSKRIDHKELTEFIQKIAGNNKFRIKTAGHSLEGREIYLISLGSGPINVLAWSQMHGDESTATMALLDIFNFFNTEDEYDSFKNDLLERVTLHFIPMLNPDGAEKFTRRNALQIDLNRDALRLEFPESKILKSVRDSINPAFGFNLHDQSTLYTAGISKKSATISFLAPAYNYAKDINDVRTNTMKLIASIYTELSNFIPGHIGRYNDDFEPRAFGDNFVKWGTSSVLIESGGWRDDVEKQFIRRLNFTALLSGFQSIATKSYDKYDLKDYTAIPENEKMLFDLLLRNLSLQFKDHTYKIDVGINLSEKSYNGNEGYYFQSTVEDIGDLSTFYGYKDIDCSGLKLEEGSVYENGTGEEPDENFAVDLLKKGFVAVKLENAKRDQKFTNLPINVVNKNGKQFDFKINKPANFIILDGEKIRYSVINGFIFDHSINKNLILNGLIID